MQSGGNGKGCDEMELAVKFELVSVRRQTREPMRNKEGATQKVRRRGSV